MMKISVCIATFNGEKYIIEQLDSILSQLSENDEVVIVDDGSYDSTVSLLKKYSDKRILLYVNDSNYGVNYSFNKAITHSSGDIVILSDQDDIWIDGRVDLLSKALKKSNAYLVSSNFLCIDNSGKKIHGIDLSLSSSNSNKYLRNIFDIFIGKQNYYGCTMAFVKDFKRYILPFPHFIESHDLWMALASNLYHSNVHLNSITLLHRIHGSNASILKRSWCKKIYSRLIFVLSIFVLIKRRMLIK